MAPKTEKNVPEPKIVIMSIVSSRCYSFSLAHSGQRGCPVASFDTLVTSKPQYPSYSSIMSPHRSVSKFVPVLDFSDLHNSEGL